MRNRKLGKSLLASALGIAALAGLSTPAGAAATTATFTLTGGTGLAITAPASSALSGGTTESSATTATQMGAVSVSDTRGALAGTWTATVSSSDFTTTGEGAPAIAKDNVSYWSGAATASSGTATRLPGQLLAANKVTLDVSRTAFSASAVIGNNTAAWNPTVSVTVPAGSVAGTYTGTITHSVA
ncbi:MAG TPA: hypothetical protein VMY88_05140 [Acidimicrobiales bacterium]|nr:hypothetical protein [Acidimicrobiales bacterium]